MAIRAYLGGSFDPIHHSHCQMAMAVWKQLTATFPNHTISVALLPTAGNPFKGNPTPAHHRLAMLHHATHGTPIEIDEREIYQPPPVYTIDTVKLLRQQHPDDCLIFIIGWDSLESLPRWKGFDELCQMANFWVFARQGFDDLATKIDVRITERFTDNLSAFIAHQGQIYLDSYPIEAISSTLIRQRLANGQAPLLLNPSVADYIAQHQLYQSD